MNLELRILPLAECSGPPRNQVKHRNTLVGKVDGGSSIIHIWLLLPAVDKDTLIATFVGFLSHEFLPSRRTLHFSIFNSFFNFYEGRVNAPSLLGIEIVALCLQYTTSNEDAVIPPPLPCAEARLPGANSLTTEAWDAVGCPGVLEDHASVRVV